MTSKRKNQKSVLKEAVFISEVILTVKNTIIKSDSQEVIKGILIDALRQKGFDNIMDSELYTAKPIFTIKEIEKGFSITYAKSLNNIAPCLTVFTK